MDSSYNFSLRLRTIFYVLCSMSYVFLQRLIFLFHYYAIMCALPGKAILQIT